MQSTLFNKHRDELTVQAIHQSVGRFTPRDYQSKAIEKILKLFGEHSSGVLARQATGTGKTILGTLVAEQWLANGSNHRVIILCHERQLVQQFADEVEDVLGFRPGIEMADMSVKANRIPKITVASRATLLPREIEDEFGEKHDSSRLYKFDTMRYKWLVILDESHRYAYKLKSCRHILDWFEKNSDSRRLGLTATPIRGDGVSLSRVTPDVAIDYPLYTLDDDKPCAVGDGWAVPYDQRFVTVEGVDFKNIKEVAKDFDSRELEQVLGEHGTVLKLVHPLFDLVEGRRTIIFNPGVEMAKLVARTINAVGEQWAKQNGKPCPGTAMQLDGSSPDHVRKDVYARHQAGEFQFLSVCNLCREGYNDPGIRAIAAFRPTKSRGLAEQMKGRGCRPLKGCVDSTMTRDERLDAIAASEKPNCMIVDLVGITGLADCASTAHVLAEGKPDEVIDRANENALKKDGPIDMGEEVRRAEREIEEEKRSKAQLEREARERRERYEAERRAKLRADVRYTSEVVRQGKGSRVTSGKNQRGARMPFGKHKGKLIADVPHGYLQWLAKEKKVAKKTDWVYRAVMDQLNGGGAKEPTPLPAPSTKPQPAPPKKNMSMTDINAMLMEVEE